MLHVDVINVGVRGNYIRLNKGITCDAMRAEERMEVLSIKSKTTIVFILGSYA